MNRIEKAISRVWWKILGVCILIYVIIAGFLVPLKPGIQSVDPGTASTGDTLMLSVNAYNTHFVDVENEIRIWLKLDEDHSLSAVQHLVSSQNNLVATFHIPDGLPNKYELRYATLIIDNPVDGPAIMPDAISIVSAGSGIVEEARWEEGGLENLNIKDNFTFPYRNILAESIRNTYFHVALWLSMVIILLIALVYSIKYLKSGDLSADLAASSLTKIGTIYGTLGILTGMVWAKNTWGAYWPQDVKLNMTAIALLIYFAYFILRNAVDDPVKRARVAAVYNVFSFTALVPLIYIIPRLSDSLHPGMGGNPALGGEDLDNTMRLVFYPAIIGWTLLGLWMASISFRINSLRQRVEEVFWDRMN